MPHNGWQPPQFPMPQQPSVMEPEAPGPEAPEAEGYMPTAEELELLVKLGIDPDVLEENLRRRRGEEAAALTPLPEGRNVGGTYVAAHPLEHLAALAQRAGGLYRQGKLDDERERTLREMEQGLKARYGVGLQTYGYPSPFRF